MAGAVFVLRVVGVLRLAHGRRGEVDEGGLVRLVLELVRWVGRFLDEDSESVARTCLEFEVREEHGDIGRAELGFAGDTYSNDAPALTDGLVELLRLPPPQSARGYA